MLATCVIVDALSESSIVASTTRSYKARFNSTPVGAIHDRECA